MAAAGARVLRDAATFGLARDRIERGLESGSGYYPCRAPEAENFGQIRPGSGSNPTKKELKLP